MVAAVKSLLVFSEVGERLGPWFFLVDGDWSRFQNVYINGTVSEQLEGDEDEAAILGLIIKARSPEAIAIKQELYALVFNAETGDCKIRDQQLSCIEVASVFAANVHQIHVVCCGIVS